MVNEYESMILGEEVVNSLIYRSQLGNKYE
jgi:hypothetical protein